MAVVNLRTHMLWLSKGYLGHTNLDVNAEPTGEIDQSGEGNALHVADEDGTHLPLVTPHLLCCLGLSGVESQDLLAEYPGNLFPEHF